MFPAALVELQVEQRQLSWAQQTVALMAVDMCWLFQENNKKKKKVLKSGILLKSLSNRSNNEVTYYIIVVLKLTHSNSFPKAKTFCSAEKKGNFGIFDPAFHFSPFFISTVLNNSLETGWSVIFHALKSAWFYHQQAQTQNPGVSQWLNTVFIHFSLTGIKTAVDSKIP